jgi:hypothetical protein
MRQYWRDVPAPENWIRSLPPRQCWIDFLRTPGAGFWHETYFTRGGMEAFTPMSASAWVSPGSLPVA